MTNYEVRSYIPEKKQKGCRHRRGQRAQQHAVYENQCGGKSLVRRRGERIDPEVKALSPHHRFVIALHSPDGVAETGLCVWPPEKNAQ